MRNIRFICTKYIKMLIRFVVNNFRSFNEEVELNMIAQDYRKSEYKTHIYNLGKIDVLKSAAIYGANGAGKSNLVKAFKFFHSIIKNGIKHSVDQEKFKLCKECLERPIEMEMEFSIQDKVYAYGFCLNDNYISEEWLIESGITSDDKEIFTRHSDSNGKPKVSFVSKYVNSKEDKLLIQFLEDRFLEPNELVLSKWKELKISEITAIRSWLVDNIIIIDPDNHIQGLTQSFIESNSLKNFTNNLLRSFDTGVDSLSIGKYDVEESQSKIKLSNDVIEKLQRNEAVVMRSKYDEAVIMKEDGKNVLHKLLATHYSVDDNSEVFFPLSCESDGTRRLLDFIPAFKFLLKSNYIFIIDEIDRSIHPSMLKALIRRIMKEEKTKGQIIFTTHESNLLDMEIFRPDEIWFIEKDRKKQNSHLYSLSEFKPRNDLDIKKGYLKGRFGAIPFLANLDELSWQNCDA